MALRGRILPGVLASQVPVRFWVNPSVAASGSIEDPDIRILEALLCMNEHNLKDRYGWIPAQLRRDAEARWGIGFSRAWLINKQALHLSSHFTRSVNELLGAVLVSAAPDLLKARAVLSLHQATVGNNGYQNIHMFGDSLAIGNNSFCQDVAAFRTLVTFGQAGCIVMLVTAGARQCFMHFSTNREYQTVMESQLAAWLQDGEVAAGGRPEFRIVSHDPLSYRDLIVRLAPGGRVLVHRKAKADVYDLRFDFRRDAFAGQLGTDLRAMSLEFSEVAW